MDGETGFLVPPFAERAGLTTWHPHHIAERYGLFFIIVLGETILSSTVAVQQGFTVGPERRGNVALVTAGGVLIVFSLWWLYFSRNAGRVLARARSEGSPVAYLFGFGHYVIFASATAVGAGLAARAEYAAEPPEHLALVTSAAVTVPVALLLVAMWAVHLRLDDPSWRTALPFFGAAGLVLLDVVVAEDLAPAETAVLDRSLVVAIVTEAGGRTSHTAILAAQRGIPAVVQCEGALDLESGLPVAVDGDTGRVTIDPSADLVAAGSLDNVIRIWDVNTGLLVERLRGHGNSVYSVAFTPDGRGLVTGSLDKTLKYWDLGPLLRSSHRTTALQQGSVLSGQQPVKQEGGEKGSTCDATFVGHQARAVLSLADPFIHLNCLP